MHHESQYVFGWNILFKLAESRRIDLQTLLAKIGTSLWDT